MLDTATTRKALEEFRKYVGSDFVREDEFFNAFNDAYHTVFKEHGFTEKTVARTAVGDSSYREALEMMMSCYQYAEGFIKTYACSLATNTVGEVRWSTFRRFLACEAGWKVWVVMLRMCHLSGETGEEWRDIPGEDTWSIEFGRR